MICLDFEIGFFLLESVMIDDDEEEEVAVVVVVWLLAILEMDSFLTMRSLLKISDIDGKLLSESESSEFIVMNSFGLEFPKSHLMIGFWGGEFWGEESEIIVTDLLTEEVSWRVI
jgi:hypothetical protein